MECSCENYGILELDRHDISTRIKQTKKLKSNLHLVAKNQDAEDKLYRCNACNQLWQSSHAWNFGNREYLFKVPDIDVVQWHKRPYVAPDEILIYLARMTSFLEQNKFHTSDIICRNETCSNKSLTGRVLCLRHHIESLQHIGNLPQKPSGIFFEPYERTFQHYQALFDETVSKNC